MDANIVTVPGRHAGRGEFEGTERPILALVEEALWIVRLELAPRACCCPAKPSVVAIMPSGADRAVPADLLLCSVHYREAAGGLRDAGAVVYSGSLG
ncbi:MAG TPA: hypothetical protein VKS82_25360 [Streptosporangiaceae bacterium]|nr:hypothetical protein [Streptosporangiaceae bacterium]